MPCFYPTEPIFADPSEQVVWEVLMKQLPVDAVITINLNFCLY